MEPLSATAMLLTLPAEVVLHICTHLTTPSFLHFASTCTHIFKLISTSREILLHHLKNVPGIKLGLDDHSLNSHSLWLLLRQRASLHLYGQNFNADCHVHSFGPHDINSGASSITTSLAHGSIALAMNGGANLQQYTSSGDMVASIDAPYAGGDVKIMQVVQNRQFTSVLYAHKPTADDSDLSIHADLPLPTLLPIHRRKRFPAVSTGPVDRTDPVDSSNVRYNLVHYDLWQPANPVCFRIQPPPGCGSAVPTHLSIFNRLKIAIVWTPTDTHWGYSGIYKKANRVMIYVATAVPHQGVEGTYSMAQVFPPKPPKNDLINDEGDNDDDDAESREFEQNTAYHRCRSPIASKFRLEGARLSLYSPGSLAPFYTATIDTSSVSTLDGATLSRTYDRVVLNRNYLRMDNAFYGSHRLGLKHFCNSSCDHSQDQIDYDLPCTHTYLHLAVLHSRPTDVSPYPPEDPIAMCIIQARCPTPIDECSHYVDLDSGQMPTRNMRGWSNRVVARLWGWKRPDSNTMSALDVIAVSKAGTRIAMSYWNEVYIWALQPEVLCEEWGDDLSDDESDASSQADSDSSGDDDDGSADSDTASIAGSAAEPGGHDQHNLADDDGSSSHSSNARSRQRRKGMIRATKFYPVKRDVRLGRIVELQPIVLKLPDGAVARKMAWTASSKPETQPSGSDDDSESISYVGSDCGSVTEGLDGNKHDIQVKGLDVDKGVLTATQEQQSQSERDGVLDHVPQHPIRLEPNPYNEVDTERNKLATSADAVVCATAGISNLQDVTMRPSQDWNKNKTMNVIIEDVEDADETQPDGNNDRDSGIGLQTPSPEDSPRHLESDLLITSSTDLDKPSTNGTGTQHQHGPEDSSDGEIAFHTLDHSPSLHDADADIIQLRKNTKMTTESSTLFPETEHLTPRQRVLRRAAKNTVLYPLPLKEPKDNYDGGDVDSIDNQHGTDDRDFQNIQQYHNDPENDGQNDKQPTSKTVVDEWLEAANDASTMTTTSSEPNHDEVSVTNIGIDHSNNKVAKKSLLDTSVDTNTVNTPTLPDAIHQLYNIAPSPTHSPPETSHHPSIPIPATTALPTQPTPTQSPSPTSPSIHPSQLSHITKPPNEKPKRKQKQKPRKKRVTENQLTILTDRGLQVWDMGVWSKGRRERSVLRVWGDGLEGKDKGV